MNQALLRNTLTIAVLSLATAQVAVASAPPTVPSRKGEIRHHPSRIVADDWIDDTFVLSTLQVPWMKPGTKLLMGVRGSMGFPLEAFERLFWTDGHQMIQIKSLSQLENLVEIRTAADALQFARLRTSRELFFLWMPARLEYMSSKVLSLDQSYGNTEWFARSGRVASSPYSYIDGVVPEASFRRSGISSATVLSEPGGFRIMRTILEDPRTGVTRCLTLVERVTRDGRYSVISKSGRPFPAGIPSTWSAMTFE